MTQGDRRSRSTWSSLRKTLICHQAVCQVSKPRLYCNPFSRIIDDLSLHMLLLVDISPLLNVIRLQLCWSWLDRLATDFMKGTKAISALHPHTPTLTQYWDWGRAVRIVGQTEEMEGGGVRGPVKESLSCPVLLRQSASPFVQQHHPFFIHHPLCPPPLYAIIGQIVE